MYNYKNLKFKDSLDGFKRWTYEFEPLERGENVKYFQKNGYYLSLEHVHGSYGSGNWKYDFVGATLRVFKDYEFEFPNNKDEILQTVFAAEIADYEKQNNSKMYF